MSEKSKKEKSESLERRVHTINLRRGFLKAPKWKRAKRAVKVLRDYVKKHYRSDNLKIGKGLNEYVWSRGAKNPPPRVRVVAIKKGDLVSLELEKEK